MEIRKAKKADQPAWITELVAKLAPHIDRTTRFARVGEDNTQAFGISLRDGQLSVQIQNAASAKTTVFLTDGKHYDTTPIQFGDGYVHHRIISDWKYCIVENIVKGKGERERTVRVCFTRDKALHATLRTSVGLPPW